MLSKLQFQIGLGLHPEIEPIGLGLGFGFKYLKTDIISFGSVFVQTDPCSTLLYMFT